MYTLHYTCLNIADRLSPPSAEQIVTGAHGQGGEGKGTSSANGANKGPFAGTGRLGLGPASSHPVPIARGDVTSVPRGAPKSSTRIRALADVRHGSTPSFGSGRESKAVCRVGSSFPSAWGTTASSSSAGAGRDQPGDAPTPHEPPPVRAPTASAGFMAGQDITQRNKGGSLQKSSFPLPPGTLRSRRGPSWGCRGWHSHAMLSMLLCWIEAGIISSSAVHLLGAKEAAGV